MTLLESVIRKPTPSAPKGIIYGPPGIGKAQPLDAKVLTPDGFVDMADIEVGDKVIGADGKAHRVLGVYPQGEKDVFRIVFRDGSSTECCDEHLWFTRTVTDRAAGRPGAVRSLETIRNSLHYGTRFNHAVPRVAPVEFAPGGQLPLAPWLLGIYLGDGCSRGSSVVITNPEPDVRKKIAESLPEGDTCVSNGRIGLRIKTSRNSNSASATKIALRKLGLDGSDSSEKFVPQGYLRASIAERRELLQGLLDSDGFVVQPGAIEFCTISARLAKDICYLIRSLGGSAKQVTKQPTYNYCGKKRNGRLAYRVYASFTNGLVPVSSDKHLGKWEAPRWAIRHTIRRVEPAGRKLCQCIKIAALDSLYVTDDFVVTHNTTFGASAENSLIIDCENGAGALQCQRTPYLSTWEEIDSWLTAVETESHPYKAVAVDSLDWMLRRIEEQVSGAAGKVEATLNRSHGGYGNGKQVMRNYVYQQLLPKLDRIVNRGIAVLLLAHAKRTEITDVDGVTTEKSTAEIPDGYLNVFVEWSDFVCLARLDGEGQRVLITEETPWALAKNRYRLPNIIPLSWPRFTSAISSGLSQTFKTEEN